MPHKYRVEPSNFHSSARQYAKKMWLNLGRLPGVYHYRCWQEGSWASVFRTTGEMLRTSRHIVFYPQLPGVRRVKVLAKILLSPAVRFSGATSERADLAIRFHTATYSPTVETDPVLEQLAARCRVVNGRCADISKARIEAVFAEVFGYSLDVDSTTYDGPCVKKTNLKAQAEGGRVVQGPIAAPEDGYVYQRLIDNRASETEVLDVRVPIFDSLVPFVYRKYRPLANRFSNQNSRVEIAEVNEVFTAEEVDNILAFCRAMDVDYAELDVLQDRRDGRIYIVDVNDTPNGPPNHIRPEDGQLAVWRMAEAFEQAFLDR